MDPYRIARAKWQSQVRNAGPLSTTAIYRKGPSARIISDYWADYDEREELACFACSWRGLVGDGDTNLFDELFDVRCPHCDQMLLVVSHPMVADIERAARRGSPGARAQLAQIDRPAPDVDHVGAIRDLLEKVIGDIKLEVGVVEHAASEAYLQFLLSDKRDGMLIEAVDLDKFGSAAMTTEQVAALTDLGFERTDANFQTTADDLSETAQNGIASLLVAVLHDVYAVPVDGEIRVNALGRVRC